MPLLRRVSTLLPLSVISLVAQQEQAVVPIGDDATWVAVGAILTALSFGGAKALDRLQNRQSKNSPSRQPHA